MAHVTIENTPSFVKYSVTTSDDGPFTVPFAIFDEADLVVEVDGESIGTAFSFTPTSSTTGGYQTGTVTLDAAVANAEVLIYRNITPARTSDYGVGPLPKEAVNNEFDKMQAQVADLRRDVNMSLRLDYGSTIDRIATGDAGQLLVLDSTGQPAWADAAEVDVNVTLGAGWAGALATALNTFITTSVQTEIDTRYRDIVTDGATNNTTALSALNTYLDTLTYQKTVLFPAGVTSAATWPNFDIRYLNFRVAGDARIRNTGTGDTFQINAGGGVTEDYFYGTNIIGPLGIEGASGSGRGVILNGIQRSLFSQFHVLGCGTDDEAIRIEHGVCLCTINFAASQFFRHPNPPGWYDNAQPKRGLVITKRSFLDQQSGHNLHVNLMMEGISEDGILLDYCVGENFIGGTSESNLHASLSRGFRSTANCFGHRVFSLDVEGIASAIDFDITAASGELIGIHAEDAVVVRNGAEDTYIAGGDVDALHVETGATDTTIIGTRFRRYTQAVGLSIGTNTTKVLTPAFVYSINGVTYGKATAETALGNDVIPVGTYGAVALDIGTDGVIDLIEATNNAVGYASAALAAAGLPAVAANHVRVGYVTASKSDGAFTFGTTALNAANTTVAYSGELLVTLLDNGTRTWILGAIDTTNNRRVHKTFSFSAHRNSVNQTGITSATYTKFAPTTESWDYGAAFDAASNYRWTPPLVGAVRIMATLWVSGCSAGTDAVIAVYKNGVALRFGPRAIVSSDNIAALHVDVLDEADGDDYYEVFFRCTENSAGSITVNGTPSLSFMQGHVA